MFFRELANMIPPSALDSLKRMPTEKTKARPSGRDVRTGVGALRDRVGLAAVGGIEEIGTGGRGVADPSRVRRGRRGGDSRATGSA